MPQTAAISATQAPIALTAVTAMATGSEGAETGAGESVAAGGVQQLSAEEWAAKSPRARKYYNQTQRKNHELGRK